MWIDIRHDGALEVSLTLMSNIVSELNISLLFNETCSSAKVFFAFFCNVTLI